MAFKGPALPLGKGTAKPGTNIEAAAERSVLSVVNRHLGVTLALILALLAGVALLIVRTLDNLNERASWVSHTQLVRVQLARTLSTLTDAEAGQRGYLLTHEEEYLAPYTSARARIDGEVTALVELTSDNTAQQQNVEQLKQLVAVKLRELERTIQVTREQGPEAALEIVRTNIGQRTMESIRTAVERIYGEENRLLTSRTMDAVAVGRRLSRVVLVAPLIGAIIAGFAFFIIRREVTIRSQLQQALHERNRLDSLGTIAAGVAHVLNNALTVVVGNTDLLMSQLPQDHPARGSVADIQSASERAVQLSRSLLAYAGTHAARGERVDLAKLVATMHDSLRQAAGSVEVNVQVAPQLPVINSDSEQLSRLLISLVRNAAEASRPGDQITVCADVAMLNSAAIARCYGAPSLSPGPHVRLSVEDRGAGVDPQIQARIFDPFFTTKFIGRGVGLSEVFGIVRRWGGGIDVESRPELGTSVRTYFPPAAA